MARRRDIEQIDIDLIDVGERLRDVDQDKVDAIKVSILELGLRTPLTLRVLPPAEDSDDSRLGLVAGAHRLEAVRQLGKQTVDAIIVTMTDLDAELWEIDENLCRAELTPADRAVFVARRKDLYEIKYPQSALGNNQHTRVRKICEPSSVDISPHRFTFVTAQIAGISERAVQLDAERGEKIGRDVLQALRMTDLDSGTYLDRLKKVPREKQLETVQRDLERKSVGHAIGTKSASKEERGDDLYETPIEAVRTLLGLESFALNVLEPSVGKGAILRPFEDAGYEVTISDLVDREITTKHGECQRVGDFLKSRPQLANDFFGSADIVTNPPYGVANAYIAHALRAYQPRKMAMLLNLNFLAGFEDPDRCFVMDEAPPSRIYVFTRRLPMMHRDGWTGKEASSQMNTGWFVWERNEDGSYGHGFPQVIRVDWKAYEATRPLLPGAGGNVSPIGFVAPDPEFERETPRKDLDQRVEEEFQRAMTFIAKLEPFSLRKFCRHVGVRSTVGEALVDALQFHGLIEVADAGEWVISAKGISTSMDVAAVVAVREWRAARAREGRDVAA